MYDFIGWCNEQKLINILADGTVTWKEEVCGGKKISHKEKFAGGRDARKDLSGDYKDPYAHMGTVWPFKVLAKGSGKAKAPVGK